MQFLLRLRSFFKVKRIALVCFSFFWWGGVGLASESSSLPIHFSGDRQVWNRQERWVELFGNARVNRLGEVITADYILLRLEEQTLIAEGQCDYRSDQAVMFGKKMTFDFKDQTGSIEEGQVQHPHFTLKGKKIEKKTTHQFVSSDSDYTTCQDCSPSWSIGSKKLDMTLNDYLFLKGMTFRVKDTPVLWLPYFVLPTKTKRQTGFLMPSWSFSKVDGWMFTLPFFWAIHRSLDMTLTGGYYFNKGTRFQWEGRYALSERSQGEALFSYLRDPAFDIPHRWGVQLSQSQEFGKGFEQRFRILEASDNLYPYFYPLDLSGTTDSFLRSQWSLSQQSSYGSAYFSLTRDRNLLLVSPKETLMYRKVSFDPSFVQAFPSLFLSTRAQPLQKGSPFLLEFSTGMTYFTRPAGSFDYDDSSLPFGSNPPPSPLPSFRPGIDPIRKATRFFFFPVVYTSFRWMDFFSFSPRVEYKGFFYDFQNLVPPLFRGYLLLQAEISTQLEKIYEFPNELEVPRMKHLIRPVLTYSLIPTVQGDQQHPFLGQIQTGQKAGWGGYYFDQQDMVPLEGGSQSSHYYTPIGHSLAYGLNTQWIRRRGRVELDFPTYQTIIDLSAGQAMNFLAWNRPQVAGGASRFSRFWTRMNLYFDHLSSQSTYYYYPNHSVLSPPHVLMTQVKWTFEQGVHRRLFSYERSLSLGYVYDQVSAKTSNLSGQVHFSISDYWMPFGGILYDLQANRLFSSSAGLLVQSPSACWRYFFKVDYLLGRQLNLDAFNLSLNLSGSTFSSTRELSSGTF